MDDLYYSDYIELDKILNSQHPRSFSSMENGNDEMLFIIIHQAYELWFKQIIFELDLVRHILVQDGRLLRPTLRLRLRLRSARRARNDMKIKEKQ